VTRRGDGSDWHVEANAAPADVTVRDAGVDRKRVLARPGHDRRASGRSRRPCLESSVLHPCVPVVTDTGTVRHA